MDGDKEEQEFKVLSVPQVKRVGGGSELVQESGPLCQPRQFSDQQRALPTAEIKSKLCF